MQVMYFDKKCLKLSLTRTLSDCYHACAASVCSVVARRQFRKRKRKRSSKPCSWSIRHINLAAYGTWVVLRIANGTFLGISLTCSVAYQYEDLSPKKIKADTKFVHPHVAFSSSDFHSLFSTSYFWGDIMKPFPVLAIKLSKSLSCFKFNIGKREASFKAGDLPVVGRWTYNYYVQISSWHNTSCCLNDTISGNVPRKRKKPTNTGSNNPVRNSPYSLFLISKGNSSPTVSTYAKKHIRFQIDRSSFKM